ncbi:hypothetical protein FB559_6468 [Actinoallomurus bryophytorum]|uniref:Uncharacterized protein n=1 Tax=Actinoallomurus bryophytorum TaxID=1490222 RepID=A0A543CUI8_9ACTN|nr:hypothetical protein [Actinoallomurus bryophytorum]TQM00747.1 hypothetical protein FB559_6468 [Actinoallomurus bryophytorum]
MGEFDLDPTIDATAGAGWDAYAAGMSRPGQVMPAIPLRTAGCTVCTTHDVEC